MLDRVGGGGDHFFTNFLLTFSKTKISSTSTLSNPNTHSTTAFRKHIHTPFLHLLQKYYTHREKSVLNLMLGKILFTKPRASKTLVTFFIFKDCS